MRGILASWLLLLPSIAVADEDPPSVDETDEVEAVAYLLKISPSGQYSVNGIPVTRASLKDLVETEDGQGGVWTVKPAPGTAKHMVLSVLDLLKREGVDNITLDEPPPPPPVSTGPAPDGATPAPTIAVAAPSPVSFIADVRFGLAAEGLGPDDGVLRHAFVLNRTAAGAQAKLGAHSKGKVLLEMVETRDGNATGISARVRDAWVDLPLTEDGAVIVRSGVQLPIFGTQAWYNDDVDGFYTVSRRFQSVTVLSGVHAPRALGVSARGKFADDRGTAALMISNTGNFQATEDNTGKDVSGRLQYELAPPVTAVVTGRYGVRNEDNSGTLTAATAALRYSSDTLDVTAEGLIGSEENVFAQNDEYAPYEGPLVGTNLAAGLTLPPPLPVLQSLRLTGRLAYYDPYAQSTNYDAWLQTSAGLIARWRTDEAMQVLGGIGYEVETPMNADLPILHRAMVETNVEF